MNNTIENHKNLVLIVDDERLNRIQLRLFVEGAGYQTVEAQNGKEALTVFGQLHPDIVLLDAMMPEMDGFECCRQLQSLDFSKYIPVLMITGLDDQESVDRAFEAGAIDYVTKPIHWPVLLQRIKRLIHQSQLQQQQELLTQELQKLAIIDELTQVANRRKFEVYFDQEWRRMAREQKPLSLILCDVDFFKSYNDTYGHRVGDRCLQKVAQAIKDAARRSVDLVSRYGGEEFAVILPNTDVAGATQVAQKICSAVSSLAIPHSSSSVNSHVTLSAGVATIVPQPGSECEEMIIAADKALYQAKSMGRDRVLVYNWSLEIITGI
ncbi:PleD family two-component system response regulator [Nostoc sp. FACHB-152]|uniref:response regulator n=1 Tax=unclassified Nostoc TaxID=2593658 RepID=UPI0016879BF8|nr:MULTISPECIES: PleD family two-component system response regulator [unclassified Nostoc]MBD2446543.1 PleD family two-component system response regulator [Nostoc sp. FACHB-152]MBD2468660.1 PleD family two-component system response regulator [Nostoc sp. FACHB-145]